MRKVVRVEVLKIVSLTIIILKMGIQCERSALSREAFFMKNTALIVVVCAKLVKVL